MKNVLLIAAAALAVPLAQVSAAPLVYEPFDYAVDSNLTPGPGAHIGLTIPDAYTPHAGYDGTRTVPSGATDTQHNAAPNWIESPGTSDELANLPRVIAGNLSRTGLPAPVGNSLRMNDVGVVAAKVPLPQDHTDGSIYYSMMFNVTDGVADTGAGNGSFLSGLIPSGWSGAIGSQSCVAPVTIHINGTGYSLGTAHRDTATRVFDDTKVFAEDETVFLVVRYDLNAGNDNDVARLYLFGAGDTISMTEPLAANVTASSVGDAASNDLPVHPTLGVLGLRSFMLRQNGVEPDVMQVDELRIGTTWADVVVPEPAGLGFVALGMLGLTARRRRNG